VLLTENFPYLGNGKIYSLIGSGVYALSNEIDLG